MPTRTHYVVLGVAESASQDGIRQAYRDLAHRHHPDRAGVESADQFREIVTAYRTLSDPERRARYDAGLRDVGRGALRVTSRPRPDRIRDLEVEPLVPRRPSPPVAGRGRPLVVVSLAGRRVHVIWLE